MTRLSAEQFQMVTNEVVAMLSASDVDEAWRVLKMFADGRFNFALADFPIELRRRFVELGATRIKSYEGLVERIRAVTGTFEAQEFGGVAFSDRVYPLLKLVSKPPASPYATQLPICLVAGIHGDEPDGVFGALEFARRFAAVPELVSTYALTIYPCINPIGYEQMTRENGNGKDLNREFLRDSGEQEVQLMERELRRREFTGFIGGHSDYESFGIYAYATGAVLSERLAKPALFQASSVIPINTDPIIDGQPAQYGIINQKFAGSLGPLTKGKTEPFDITIETPNLLALQRRVEAQAIAFETILQEYRAVAAEGMYL